jgi:hypothetical protein
LEVGEVRHPERAVHARPLDGVCVLAAEGPLRSFPGPGEHTDEVLRETLGLDDARLAELRARRDRLIPIGQSGGDPVAMDLNELVAPAHTALVTQEIQRGVVGDLSALPDLAEAAADALPQIAALAEAARAAGVPVIHCTVGVGVSVNVAIQCLAFDAVNASYQVVIPRDAVAGFPQEYVEAVFANSLGAVATLVDTQQVLDVWRRRG